MSIKVSSYMWEHSTQKGTRLLLLLAICDMANDDGVCWPSMNTLAKKARTDRRHAIRIVNSLVKAGELEVFSRTDENNPSGSKSNLFLVKVPWAKTPIKEKLVIGPRNRGGVVQPPRGEWYSHHGGSGTATTGGVVQPPPESSLEPSIESSDFEPSLSASAQPSPVPEQPVFNVNLQTYSGDDEEGKPIKKKMQPSNLERAILAYCGRTNSFRSELKKQIKDTAVLYDENAEFKRFIDQKLSAFKPPQNRDTLVSAVLNSHTIWLEKRTVKDEAPDISDSPISNMHRHLFDLSAD